MVKHTQTICRLLPTNCLNVFEQFMGLAFKGLTEQRLFSLDQSCINDMPFLMFSNFFWKAILAKFKRP